MKSLYTPSTAILMFMSLWCAKAQTIMNIHQSNGTVLQIPLNTIDSITYTINNPGVLATLSTLPIGNITSASATSGGNITANGGTSVTQRGVVWSTSPNPTTANSLSNDGSGTGNYTSTLSGLAANTTYYVRAYAINSAGTAYGNQLTFATTGGVGSITTLNCSSSTNNGSLVAGVAASGVSSIVPYTGGNGGTYSDQNINSTGVTGLTATSSAGNFNFGNGSLTYAITGTPSAAGIANFNLNIGGQNCTLSVTVNVGSITTLNCSSSTNNGSLVAGAAANGLSSIVPYTGGNGGTFSAQSINSTGVTGLTATLLAGNFNIGNGSLTYAISGTPSAAGAADFNLNIGGQNCTLNLTVNAVIVSTPGSGVTFNGYTYSTVVLGNGQEWMAENLRTSTYRNGDPIPNVTDSSQWVGLTTGAWAHYSNDSQYENPYGKLYNWYAVADPRQVCPPGWHVPTDTEWSVLINYLDPNADGGDNVPNVAGGKMKSTGTQYWQSPNTDATNESGFSALPSGFRHDVFGYFQSVGGGIILISSSELTGTEWCWGRYLNFNSGTAGRSAYDKPKGFSVRCLRD